MTTSAERAVINRLDPDELPVVERIALVIVSRLALVKREEGFLVDLGPVVRPTRLGDAPKSHGMIELDQLNESIDEDNCTQGNPRLVAIKQPFTISIYAIDSDKQTRPIDQWINLFAAEVKRAITCGPEWYRFEGNALLAEFAPSANFRTINGDFAGISLNLAVTYRTPENDPYTAC